MKWAAMRRMRQTGHKPFNRHLGPYCSWMRNAAAAANGAKTIAATDMAARISNAGNAPDGAVKAASTACNHT